ARQHSARSPSRKPSMGVACWVVRCSAAVMSGETVWLLPRQNGAPDAHGNIVHTWPDGPGAVGAVRVDEATVWSPAVAGREAPASVTAGVTATRQAVIVD